MRDRNIQLCTDLTNHLSERIRHVCSEMVDTADRAGLSNGEMASVLLTALACDLFDVAMMLGLTDNEFLDLMQRAKSIATRNRETTRSSAKPD